MNIKTFIETLKISVKDRMSYRFDFFFDLLIGPFIFLAVQFIWTSIYEYNNIIEVNGFSLNDSISYLAVSTIVGYFVWTWISGFVGESITRGDFAGYVLRPIDFLDYSLLNMFGHKIPSIIIKVPILFILLFLIFNIHLNTNILYLLIFFASLLLSYLLFNIFMFIMGLFSFWQESFWVFGLLGNMIITFFSGSLIPIDFYPEIFRKIIEVLPFKHIYYSPIMIYLEKYSINASIQVLISQLVSVIIFYLCAKLLLKIGSAKFTSQGG